jgi:hypothetical protein
MSSLSHTLLARAVALATLTTAAAGCADELTLGEDAEAVLLSPTEKLSQREPGRSQQASPHAVSADGRFALFTEYRSNSGRLTVLDRTTGERTIVDQPGDWIQEARMSADGNTVAVSLRTRPDRPDSRPAGVYVLDRSTGAWTTVHLGDVEHHGLSLAASGSHVGFVTYQALDPLDTNGTFDVYVHSLLKNTRTLASRAIDGGILPSFTGVRGETFLSADGGLVAYTYEHLDDHRDFALLRDLSSGALESLTRRPNGAAVDAWALRAVEDMSPDGRFFLVYRDGALHVLDRLTSTLELVERATDGTPRPTSSSGLGAELSDDGRLVVWTTPTTIDPLDTGLRDVYVHDRWMGTTQRVTAPYTGVHNDGDANTARISGNGALAAFDSESSTLVPGDDLYRDAFARPLEAVPGEVVQLNRWKNDVYGSVVEYQNAALVTDGGIAAYVDGARARVTAIAGTATYVGRTGGAATAEVQLTFNGTGYDGFVRYTDPSGESFDSRTAGTPASLTVTLLSDREAKIDLAYTGSSGHGLRLTVRGEEPFDVLASGWAWAHAATGDYDANTVYAYNPTGWTNRITRTALGQYKVRFTRQGGALGAVVHVAAYGDGNAWCKYDRQEQSLSGDLDVFVRCFTPAGAAVDSRFVASFALDTRVTGAAGHAWLSYGGVGSTLRASSSSSGGNVLFGRSGVGTYGVTLVGQSGAPANVMVTASGASDTRCKVTSSGGGLVNVQCHDVSTGALADSGFELTYMVARAAADAPGGFATAGTSTASSYTPTASKRWSSSGGTITAGHATSGSDVTHYVTFGGLSSSRSHAHVTPAGSAADYCKVTSWYNVGADLRINVRCFDRLGVAKRVPFVASYVHH